MGDRNQVDFIRTHRARFQAPFLEIGSRDYGAGYSLRELFPEETWIGADMNAGEGVDVVADFTCPFERLDDSLGGRRFGTIFCLSVLEHCEQPFAMAKNLTRLLAPDGLICISAPYAWKIHGFPKDLWRFTPDGIRTLFPDIEFEEELGHAATSFPGDTMPLESELGRLSPRSPRWHLKRGRWLRGFDVALMRIAGFVGLLRWICRFRYVMPPTMINMVGKVGQTARDNQSRGKQEENR